MNLLLFNLAVDAEHVTLAFGLKWIKALARRFDHVDVVTMYEGKHSLPANVTVWSVGHERGYPKWLRMLRFYWLVLKVLRTRRIDVAFTHMIHVFAVLFWPIGRIWGIRNLLWYAHSAVPFGLRLAHAAADAIVSSTPEGFRLPSHKVTFIGQGIDVQMFEYHPRIPGMLFHLVSVGRLSPVKGNELLLEALDGWRPDGREGWMLTVVGETAVPAEEIYASGLRERARYLSGGEVKFLGRLDPPDIARILGEADVFVNLSGTGSLDKAIVEAMAAGCIVLTCNDAFRAIAEREGLDACVVERDATSLRNALDRLVGMVPDERAALSVNLARIARRDHAFDGLIDRLADRLTVMARGYA